MVCLLRNLIYYLNACCPKGVNSGIPAIDKTHELLLVMDMCSNSFQNGAMAYSCYKFMKVLFTEFLQHV